MDVWSQQTPDCLDRDQIQVITHEEWAGSDLVFDAFDKDGDGLTTPKEMAAGLGAAFLLR